MKHQRGFAFILVLALLTVGSLMIVPILSYTGTALLSQRFAEGDLEESTGVEAALEDAIWQMLNGAMGSLNPDNPQLDFTFQFARYSITVPTIPNSQNQRYGNIHNLFFVVDPRWLAPGDTATKSYIIGVDTQKWETLTSFGFTLPAGLTYSANSTYYKGPDGYSDLRLDLTADEMYWNWKNQVDLVNHKVKMRNNQWQAMTGGGYVAVYQWPPPGGAQPGVSYLVITTEADGRQTLEWKPYFAYPAGRKVFIQSLHVTGNPGWGIRYITAWFYGTENITTGPTAALGVAMYNVIIQVEGQTVQAVIAFTATGEMVLVSYQVVQ